MKIKQISTQGFTLMEMMVIIAIIGILAAIVYASLDEARARARFTQVETTFDQVAKAAESYRFEKGHWPADTNPLPNGGVPEFVARYLSIDSDQSGGGRNLPTPPCAGYKYDWQNWPDYRNWTDQNRKHGEKVVKLSLYDNNGDEVATKCIYTEPEWRCAKDSPGVGGPVSEGSLYCCKSPYTSCTPHATYVPVECNDISTITNKTLYCN